MAEYCAANAIKGNEKPKGSGLAFCAYVQCTQNMLLVSSAVLVIAGTTAVGKTDLSLELAKLLDGEVISADSAQVAVKNHW